jgi:hypothetical protein
MGIRSPFVLVVVTVTTDGPGAGHLDLFGHPTTPVTIPAQRPPSRIESNDIDLMVTVAAVRCGYLLVGTAERVYARTDAADRVARVPRYEEDAVHQLLRRRWLSLGAAHHITCGAAHLVGIAVLVPKATRDRIATWERLQRPPSWPEQVRAPGRGDASGQLVHLDDHRRRR